MKTISAYAITLWLGMASEGEDSKERALKDHTRVNRKSNNFVTDGPQL
jgi:hypothetical protein